MITRGILNPQILELPARVRHPNTLVIADRGFPFGPKIETVAISLVDDVPTIDFASAGRGTTKFPSGKGVDGTGGGLKNNPSKTRAAFATALRGIELKYDPPIDFKKHIPHAIDLMQYGNLILKSA